MIPYPCYLLAKGSHEPKYFTVDIMDDEDFRVMVAQNIWDTSDTVIEKELDDIIDELKKTGSAIFEDGSLHILKQWKPDEVK